VRTKCVEKTSVGAILGILESWDNRPGHPVARVLHFGIRADPRGYMGVCGSRDRACGAWHVWPVVAHSMAHVPSVDAWTCAKRGSFLLGVDRQGRRSSEGDEYHILARA
jgi:hypothetical protein